MSNKIGKLIAIEGIDGVGKATQAKLLAENMTKLGFKVFLSGYPQYQSKTGKAIAAYLNGETKELSVSAISYLYTADRMAHKEVIEQALLENDYVVLDRYVLSNILYQQALCDNPKDAEHMKGYVEFTEYSTAALRPADITFVLTLSEEAAAERVLQKGTRDYTNKKQDVHEANSTLMSKVTKLCNELPDNYYGKIIKIDCHGSIDMVQASILMKIEGHD
jgi:dTMP kinase